MQKFLARSCQVIAAYVVCRSIDLQLVHFLTFLLAVRFCLRLWQSLSMAFVYICNTILDNSLHCCMSTQS